MAKENWLIGVQVRGGLSGTEEGVGTFYVEAYYGDRAKQIAGWLNRDPRVTGTAAFKSQGADKASKTFGVWDGELA